ncbi:MAG: nucleotidyltransferase domain-containing protein, partial [Candidatus Omnitrophica bacterium]|nr:nucleotidyltransferase domain-containing protein [Candidatus Omnitrophota bacterium]
QLGAVIDPLIDVLVNARPTAPSKKIFWMLDRIKVFLIEILHRVGFIRNYIPGIIPPLSEEMFIKTLWPKIFKRAGFTHLQIKIVKRQYDKIIELSGEVNPKAVSTPRAELREAPSAQSPIISHKPQVVVNPENRNAARLTAQPNGGVSDIAKDASAGVMQRRLSARFEYDKPFVNDLEIFFGSALVQFGLELLQMGFDTDVIALQPPNVGLQHGNVGLQNSNVSFYNKHIFDKVTHFLLHRMKIFFNRGLFFSKDTKLTPEILEHYRELPLSRKFIFVLGRHFLFPFFVGGNLTITSFVSGIKEKFAGFEIFQPLRRISVTAHGSSRSELRSKISREMVSIGRKLGDIGHLLTSKFPIFLFPSQDEFYQTEAEFLEGIPEAELNYVRNLISTIHQGYSQKGKLTPPFSDATYDQLLAWVRELKKVFESHRSRNGTLERIAVRLEEVTQDLESIKTKVSEQFYGEASTLQKRMVKLQTKKSINIEGLWELAGIRFALSILEPQNRAEMRSDEDPMANSYRITFGEPAPWTDEGRRIWKSRERLRREMEGDRHSVKETKQTIQDVQRAIRRAETWVFWKWLFSYVHLPRLENFLYRWDFFWQLFMRRMHQSPLKLVLFGSYADGDGIYKRKHEYSDLDINFVGAISTEAKEKLNRYAEEIATYLNQRGYPHTEAGQLQNPALYGIDKKSIIASKGKGGIFGENKYVWLITAMTATAIHLDTAEDINLETFIIRDANRAELRVNEMKAWVEHQVSPALQQLSFAAVPDFTILRQLANTMDQHGLGDDANDWNSAVGQTASVVLALANQRLSPIILSQEVIRVLNSNFFISRGFLLDTVSSTRKDPFQDLTLRRITEERHYQVADRDLPIYVTDRLWGALPDMRPTYFNPIAGHIVVIADVPDDDLKLLSQLFESFKTPAGKRVFQIVFHGAGADLHVRVVHMYDEVKASIENKMALIKKDHLAQELKHAIDHFTVEKALGRRVLDRFDVEAVSRYLRDQVNPNGFVGRFIQTARENPQEHNYQNAAVAEQYLSNEVKEVSGHLVEGFYSANPKLLLLIFLGVAIHAVMSEAVSQPAPKEFQLYNFTAATIPVLLGKYFNVETQEILYELMAMGERGIFDGEHVLLILEIMKRSDEEIRSALKQIHDSEFTGSIELPRAELRGDRVSDIVPSVSSSQLTTHDSRITPEGRAELRQAKLSLKINQIDQNFVRQLSPLDSQLFDRILLEDIGSLENLGQLIADSKGKVFVNSFELDNPNEGRTVYLTLEKPIGNVKVLRFKGVRARVLGDHLVGYDRGLGFSPWRLKIRKEDGFLAAIPNGLGIKGGMRSEDDARNEYEMMLVGKKSTGFKTDQPIGWGTKKINGQEAAFVIAGME